MRNKQIIYPIYVKILGKYLREEMKKKGLKQDEVGLTCGQDDIKMISSTTIREILKGNRNMTSEVADAFQESLGINIPKNLFFPNEEFCTRLISEILLDLFPTFPVEETSYEISEKICDWLSELACLLSQ